MICFLSKELWSVSVLLVLLMFIQQADPYGHGEIVQDFFDEGTTNFIETLDATHENSCVVKVTRKDEPTPLVCKLVEWKGSEINILEHLHGHKPTIKLEEWFQVEVPFYYVLVFAYYEGTAHSVFGDQQCILQVMKQLFQVLFLIKVLGALNMFL